MYRDHRVDGSPSIERSKEGFWIHGVGVWSYVDENWRSTRHFDSRYRCDGGVRDGCDAIAAANPQRAQSQRNSIRTVGNSHRGRKTKLPGEFLFKGFDLPAQDVPATVDNTSHGGHHLIPVLFEERTGRHLRNILQGTQDFKHSRSSNSESRLCYAQVLPAKLFWEPTLSLGGNAGHRQNNRRYQCACV